jgi:hypothetical protein
MPLIGEPIVRQEDARLLRGRGRFVEFRQVIKDDLATFRRVITDAK